MLKRTPVEVRYIRREVIKHSILNIEFDKARPFEEKTNGGSRVSTIVPCLMKIQSEYHPVMCVAIFKKETKEGYHYVMGYSVLGKGDTFSYEKAKEISADRAFSRISYVRDKAQRILPMESDMNRVPKDCREEFINICTEFYKKYELSER